MNNLGSLSNFFNSRAKVRIRRPDPGAEEEIHARRTSGAFVMLTYLFPYRGEENGVKVKLEEFKEQ